MAQATWTNWNGGNSENPALAIGSGGGSNGTYTLSGGTLTEAVQQNGWQNANYIGYGGGTGTLNVQGTGTFTAATSGYLFVGGGTDGAFNTTGTGTINLAGSGVINAPAGVFVGTGPSGSNGTINLNGGTLITPNVAGGAAGGTSTLNFNGGTLRATTSTTTFVQGLTTIQVRNGAAVVDANGRQIAIPQALLHSSIGGDNPIDGGFTVIDSSGSGTGVVELTAANTFTGPTSVTSGTLELGNALALQDSTLSSGGLTFDPAVSSHTFTVGALTGTGSLVLTDTASNPVTLGVGNLNGNSTFSGGTTGLGTLAKIGTGTLTLTGTSSLNAATQVQNGTLRIAGSAAGGTGTITVGGNGSSGTPTLAGTGTLNSPVVISGPGTGVAGILAPSFGGSSPTTLTFGRSLTLSTGSILDLTLSPSLVSGNDQVVMTGGNVLSLGTSGTVNINAPSGLSVGNYVLISNSGGTIAGGRLDCRGHRRCRSLLHPWSAGKQFRFDRDLGRVDHLDWSHQWNLGRDDTELDAKLHRHLYRGRSGYVRRLRCQHYQHPDHRHRRQQYGQPGFHDVQQHAGPVYLHRRHDRRHGLRGH